MGIEIWYVVIGLLALTFNTCWYYTFDYFNFSSQKTQNLILDLGFFVVSVIY